MTQQPPKKSGSRDISALKERLRPKSASTGAPPTRAPAPPGGTVLPPPGLAVPPPPGVATQPAPAPVPDAAHDPFGAMNAMAQAGAAQRAPEIVIVHDGKPVESVATGTKAAQIAKYAAIALVPFVVGIAIRGISKDASAYNNGITGAGLILKDVQQIKKNLGSLQAKVGEAGKSDATGRDVTAILDKFAQIEVKDELQFKRIHPTMGSDLIGRVHTFYAANAELQQMVADHVKWAKKDDAALGAALEATKKLTLPKEQQLATAFRYAVMVWNPTAEDGRNDPAQPGARLVEVGPPYCGGDDKPADSGSCPADKPPTAVAVRYAPGGNWFKGDFAMLGSGEPIASRKILPMSPNPIFEALALTPQGAASELAYRKRLENIREKLAETIELGNGLVEKLTRKAGEGKHFTFFM